MLNRLKKIFPWFKSNHSALEPAISAQIALISDFDGHSAEITDPKFLSEIKRFFRHSRKVSHIMKVTYRYKIQFTNSQETTIYRITGDGMILNDVPGSQKQMGYIPMESGLVDLIQILLEKK